MFKPQDIKAQSPKKSEDCKPLTLDVLGKQIPCVGHDDQAFAEAGLAHRLLWPAAGQGVELAIS